MSTSILVDGAYYQLTHKESGRNLDGKHDDDSVYKSKASPDNTYQWWRLDDVGNGYYQLNHKESGRNLDGKHDDDSVYKSKASSDNTYQWWQPNDAGDGYYYWTHKESGRNLDGRHDDDSVYKSPPGANEYEKWRLRFAELELDAEYIDLEYGQAPDPATKRDLLDSQTIENDTDSATVDNQISMKKALSSTFAWTLTESLGVDASIEFKVKVPLLASEKQSISVSFDFGSTQEFSSTETMTYAVQSSVTVPAHTSVKVSGYVDWGSDIEIPFTMTVRLSAKASGVALTGAQLEELIQEGDSTAEVKSIDDDGIVVTLTGVFSGSYGIETFTLAEDV